MRKQTGEVFEVSDKIDKLKKVYNNILGNKNSNVL